MMRVFIILKAHMGILCRGATDIGRKRKTNQDSICLDHSHLFYAVADGMGGHNGGDIASQVSVQLMPEFLKQNPKMEPQALMKNIILQINETIYNKAKEQPELHGMGTTITAIQFCGPQLVIGNVGDSRAYMINNKNIYQLTRDHSWVQQRLNLGVYTREEAVHDPQRNALYIAVGIDPELEVDVFNYRVCKNDIFLVCSDGLHGKVSDADILHIVQKNISDPSKCDLTHLEKTIEDLIAQANQNGGNDNISAILAVAQA